MKKIHYILALGVAVVNLTVMCKKPYNPIVADINTNILVVEGVIKNGSDSTIIKLSRTVNLNNFITANPVVGATVTIEDDQNGIIPLAAIARGQYGIPALNLDNSRKYRLRIKTPDGQVYLSDAEAVKNAPPIDSIGFTTSDKEWPFTPTRTMLLITPGITVGSLMKPGASIPNTIRGM